MGTVLVTGANRGLGLEFARQYREAGWDVVATCRNMSTASELAGTGSQIFQLDVSMPEDCQRFAQELAGRRLDLVINNAGVMGESECSALDADPDEWMGAFRTNALAPAILTRLLVDNLKQSDRPVGATLGSLSGLFSNMNSPDLAIYRSTKAAAHAVTISLGHALKPFGITYVGLRPGRTQTAMTGGTGQYSVESSVSALRGVLESVSPEMAGLFLDRTGEICPYS